MMTRMKKTIAIGIVLTLGLISISNTVPAQDVQASMMKYGRLLQLIESNYVDTTNIEDLTEKAVVEVLKQLDPHSVYISKEEVEKMNEPLQGSFEGIGISFNIFKDTLLVVATIPGGPSEKVGLQAGDRILKVDNKEIAGIGIENSDVFDMLRGDKGTVVNLKVLRNGQQDLLDFRIIRDKIPIHSLDASYMIDEETGYIKLNRFSATTTDEFTDAIKDLKKSPRFKNLVLDLRGNGGGYLKAAIELADQFLGAFKMIVYTEGENSRRKDYKASALGEFEQGKLVVLIDEGSASASEIVAGAIQDWDRGVVVGRRSFGKGLVQQPYFLNDGSMVRLTTAHYHTPSGRGIQKSYEEGVEAYRSDYRKRFEAGEFFTRDSIHFDEKLMFETMVNKRTVYGGGGVMPDIFVPMDTSQNYGYFNQMVRKNIVYTAALDYMDRNRSEFTQNYPSFDVFQKNFVIEDELVEKMVAEADKEGIERDDESLAVARPIIKEQVRAIVARDLFGQSAYYQVVNEDSSVVKEALKVLKSSSEYNNLLVEN
ncbi:S41 family peptidase [Sunxiuqinia dokdonensis]|uniref:Peptidase S41 n=1 Tax=Sunxiuqinia dokdonensis TaxID=1409788 RepID=A0A0L8V4A0_9BACT|nr:S41 family peptidase [Sunxiuqinia dokdonensis]KOH43256.1 peptidase S41 [Sunxiuqinia dokdonensis]